MYINIEVTLFELHAYEYIRNPLPFISIKYRDFECVYMHVIHTVSLLCCFIYICTISSLKITDRSFRYASPRLRH